MGKSVKPLLASARTMPVFTTPQSLLARTDGRRWGLSLLVLLALLLAAGPMQASHLLGGEMTYRYLDANGPAGRTFRYELTIGTYLNADTLPGPGQSQVPTGRTSLRVGLYQKGGPLAGEAIDVAILPRVSMRFTTPQPAPGCPPTTPVRLVIYRDTVALPFSAEGYYAYVSDGSRNIGINNINSPGHPSDQENLTLFVDMAPPLLPNSSPTFSDTAVALVCVGDTTILINNANDVDGDRLSYAFGVPYSASPAGPIPLPPAIFQPPPVLVQYAAGYSATQPFGTAPGNIAALDASTGLSTYCAVTQGRYVVAVDVSEFRRINGVSVLVGRTRRDVQLVVRLCPAGASPALSAPSIVPRSYTIEEGQSLSFPIAATTSVPNEAVTVKVNSALLDGPSGIDASFNNNPGAVAPGQATGIVTISGTGAAGASFLLNSRCGSARATPYDVLVTASSRDCRKKATSDIFRITITPAAGPHRISGDTLICDPSQVRSYTTLGPALGHRRWQVRGGSIIGADTASTLQVRWAAAPGPGTLWVKGASRFGCPLDSLLRLVTVLPTPPLSVAGGLSVCPGASTTLTCSGGSAAYTLSGGGLTLSSAGSFTLTPAVTTTYTISSTTPAGCPVTANATIVVNTVPPLVVSGSLSICPGASTTLSVAGGTGSYTLTGNGQIMTGAGPFTVAPTATTTYTINGTTPAGCAATGSVTVTVVPPAPLSVTGRLNICPGASTSLQVVGGGANYTLSGGGQTLTSSTGAFLVAPMATTTYTIAGTTPTGCATMGSVTVTVAPLTALVVTGIPRICAGISTTLTITGGVGSYLFSGGGQLFSGPGPFTVSPDTTTTYTVWGFNPAGCSISTAFTVDVNPCFTPDRSLVFYNIVSSNRDGLNDVFTIKNVEFYPGNTLAIYNRWGRQVFSTTNYQNDWGRDPSVSPGVYSYLFRLPDGRVEKGWVEVVK
jgi:gliding motility-associated-like protein